MTGPAQAARRVALSLIAAATLAGPAPAQQANPFVPAPAAAPTRGTTLRLGKCVNLSNMFDAPSPGAWGRDLRDSDIANIAAKGFTAVRFPVRFSAHARQDAPYTIDPAFLQRVRHIVDLASSKGLAVIVDMHHYADEALFKDPLREAPRFTAMWRQIGAAFADAPRSVTFELINEPNDKLDASNLRQVIDPALAAVRETNPTRPVVIDGPKWANFDEMLKFDFPDDPNIVPTFHYYDPQNVGFDKAPWMNPAVRTDFGTAADIAELKAFSARIRGFIERTGRVPFVGEVGAHESRPVAMRATYYSLVTSAFASVGVQSCAWGYTNTYHLWRDGSGWEPGIADGMATTATLPAY